MEKVFLRTTRKRSSGTPSRPSRVPDAQRAVGTAYAYGLGVAKNPIEGYAWYNIAIANGNEDAKEKNIKEIELSPEQLIEAQSLSTEIYKRIEANNKTQAKVLFCRFGSVERVP